VLKIGVETIHCVSRAVDLYDKPVQILTASITDNCNASPQLSLFLEDTTFAVSRSLIGNDGVEKFCAVLQVYPLVKCQPSSVTSPPLIQGFRIVILECTPIYSSTFKLLIHRCPFDFAMHFCVASASKQTVRVQL